MQLDPNWFYSSLAQSAAAVVGLLGSVLVVRLQYQLGVVQQQKQELFRNFVELRAGLVSHVDTIQQFISFIDTAVPAMKAALDAGRNTITLNLEYDFWGGWSGSPQEIQLKPERIPYLESSRSPALRIVETLQAFVNLTSLDQVAEHVARTRALRGQVPAAAQVGLERIEADFSRLLDRMGRFQVEASTRLATFLNIVLTWLSFFGLLLPLTYLSAHSGLTKQIFTVAFAIGLLALPGALGYQIREVRRIADLSLPLEHRLAGGV